MLEVTGVLNVWQRKTALDVNNTLHVKMLMVKWWQLAVLQLLPDQPYELPGVAAAGVVLCFGITPQSSYEHPGMPCSSCDNRFCISNQQKTQ